MISFIVIGKNISNTINRCIDSIIKTVLKNNINYYEIIYIDSNSSDDSIKKAILYENIKIYKIIKNPNAAIARNLGFDKSNGNVLFFIDGDMEIIPETLKELYSPENGLKYPFISGDWIDFKYSKNEIIKKEKYYDLNSDEYQYTTGGLFLINRNLWIKIGGMRSIFRRSQDLDLGLRLSAIGFPLLRIKTPLSIHHTVDYNNNKRYLKDLFSGNFLYQGLLYKNNLFNKKIYKEYICKEISFFILIVISVYYLFSFNLHLFMFYFLSLIFKLIYKKITLKNSSEFFIKFIIHDLNLLLSISFFWPMSASKIYFEKIK
jgi:glycosyltransferase involved in cell wall biosynthesis